MLHEYDVGFLQFHVYGHLRHVFRFRFLRLRYSSFGLFPRRDRGRRSLRLLALLSDLRLLAGRGVEELGQFHEVVDGNYYGEAVNSDVG